MIPTGDHVPDNDTEGDTEGDTESETDMSFTHTIILRHDGVTRNYHCENYFDAVVLHDALQRRYGNECVEMWRGSLRLQ